MRVYLGENLPTNQHSRNLFALRYDLHLGQWEKQTFVMVPKYGRLAVHFIRRSEESAHHFHNTIFDHGNTLSHDLLYARFAWSLIKIVGTLDLSSAFCFDDDRLPGDGRVAKDGKGGKRKRREEDDGEEKDSFGGRRGDDGPSRIAKNEGGDGRAGKHKRSGDDGKEKDADGGDHGDSSAM